VVRYLGLPTPDDNLAGYQASDVTSKAKKLDGKKFLIVHGTAGMSQAPAGA
jgi:dipeptidyl-peptidase-4